jgi:nicotinate-nucleotide--dimethylbenzimidazole phosphoribosyltransferase
MRLGEGTGGALAMLLAETSVRILSEMATFEEAGVAEKGE